ncbi:hypothetical protein RIF29_21108 [Crotalaria pallida]|uniref:Endonuclease/exonuclease/phosphatase domain-containing protein n=1 Tax=Crotalaria pallida TaxID=3830 RepID=A0AAN9F6U2_CROPI
MTSLNHIDFSVTTPEVDIALNVTCLYGYHQMPLKYQTWALLASMAKDVDEPWLVIGDINQVLGPENKMEGNPVDLAEIDNARTCLEVCNMKDIDWVGQKFTWCNRRKQPDTIEEHIDKAFSNTTWSRVWNYSKVSHLPRYSSNHSPIILDALMRTNQDARKKKKRLYRFEQFVLRNEKSESVVKHLWIPGKEVSENIRHVGKFFRIGVEQLLATCQNVLSS